jgi:protein-ribulosamine 3-kinase
VTHPLLRPAVRGPIERAASAHLGRVWTTRGFTDLDDRASHPCGILHSEPFSVFAKLDEGTDAPARFAAEIDGLALLATAGARTPVPVGSGVVALPAGAVLVSEALVEAPPDWRSVGRTLATLHRAHADRFGLDGRDNWFGPLRQDNRPSDTWAAFYAERRVLPHLRSAVGLLPGELVRDVERLVDRLPQMAGPEPRPSLLHGDAQRNNLVSTAAGAVLVDACPYFGHPELDLALVDYFEPVPVDLFDAYREVTPVDPGFAERRELWRVFAHLAVIAVAGPGFVPRLASALRTYR